MTTLKTPERGEPLGTATTAVQDGMLKYYLSQPTDYLTNRKAETEPFDYRELMDHQCRGTTLRKPKDAP